MGASATHPLGESAGVESVALTANQMPPHNRAIDISGMTATGRFRNAAANQRTPVANVPAIEATNVVTTYSSATPDANMRGSAVSLSGTLTAATTGTGTAHENRQPTLTLNYCIAIAGIFPSRP